jgi:HSP20 family protein
MHDMTLVRRTSPIGDFLTLRHTMDRLLDDGFVRPRAWGVASGAITGLPVDIHSGPDALVVDASLPGFRPEDVEITVKERTLTIRGESRTEREETAGDTLVSEIRRGSVQRTIRLPEGLEADKATATFENGVLHLSFPRAEGVKPRQIQITPTIDGHAANETSIESGVTPNA